VFYYAGARISNHNKLLGRVEGVDGIKTGFTRASGFNLMTNAKTEDRHIVAVVLGGRSGASRDQIMASLVRSNLPRAYAGARTAPMVADAPSARPVAVAEAPAPRPAASEAPAARPVMVAEARPAVVVEAGQPIRLQDANVETTAATVPTATPVARKPLDLNSLRPVVASAAGASSTTTPASPPMRWQTGPQALPQAAQAYAPVQQLQPEPARPTVAPARPAAATPAFPAPVQVASAKIEERLPAPPAVKADVSEAKHEAARPAVSGWMIQLGATDDEGKAKTMLSNAKSRSGRVLAKASPFTEKVTRDGSTLYRARFSGFAEADDAQEACKVLKRNGFACFATRS
jgi:D-alanyl-D-alanine carboxypeptidase